ncbi:SPOR domain-containing protein [uncultured Desulfobacter sp.]|uniref:SPOR domain-containing protein n=1 Tax=uncultured Desulfobacter sp. TaxID=240139 RepID=UPI0029F57460|nr:SPOR domain-containing protein [uncultured Desulfobacter sp.]
MFGLGVIVGRSSSPVMFETRAFQEHLGQIVNERLGKFSQKEKVDLKFYDVLDEPVSYPIKGKKDDPGEITPGPEAGKTVSAKSVSNNSQAEEIPVKHSRKIATWHQAEQGYDNDPPAASSSEKRASVKTEKKADEKADEKRPVAKLVPKVLKSKTQTDKKKDAPPKVAKPDTAKAPASAHGEYTIQIASYKNLNDALAQMVLLNKKGITAYRASVKIKGITWHRVRTGSFADYEAAKAGLAKLAGSGVGGMVIKKE